MFIKVCGITRLVDALHAVQQGASALGFVFWPTSPRVIGVETAREIVSALPPHVMTVGVFVNESPEAVRTVLEKTGIRAVQLHGDETPEQFADLDRPLVRSVVLDRVAEAAQSWPAGTTLLLDVSDPVRRGGTGEPIDWARAALVARHHGFVLAGGLTPLNVEEAVRTVRPIGVDVSSGVEASPGIKDFQKVTAFIASARRALGAR
jgi:phosphoribosylanthranilate isomerase